MTTEVERGALRARYGILLTALAPLVPQILGSAFNIWYNATVIEPMFTPALRQRFFATVVVYNAVVYPIGVYLWLKRIFSFRHLFHRLQTETGDQPPPLEELTQARRRLIHLPWFAAAVCGAAWFLCIPVFISALLQVQNPLDPRLLWHLPISFCVSGFIAVTHSFFLVELASQWGLFPVFFRDERADRTPNIFTLSLRGRGIVWAISASICPIASLLLLVLAPHSPATNSAWLAVFVGVIGIAFGIFDTLDRLMEVTVEAIRPIPSIALLPIALIALGFGYRMEIVIVAFACVWPILILSRAAVRSIEPRLMEVARALRLPPAQRVWKIIIPAALPRIFVAFRLSAGIALIVAVTVEIAINPLGLGAGIMLAQQALRPDLMLAYLIWIGIIGYALNILLTVAQQRLFGRAALSGDGQ